MPDRSLPLLANDHPVTRDAALARLDEFVPRAGPAYAGGRNHDHGPGRHDAVSRLSAALARRTLTEAEVLSPVVALHASGADAFVREVFWRGYFRGWIEARPVIWQGWLGALDRIDARLAQDDALAARHLAAVRGATGIACFDHWMHELAQTGYLHNWARMQVASIWIFTLGLPWELGARHFLDHLVDADAASNTLSWRWVAGLHTPGKAYLADATRIARMTAGRFVPIGLAAHARIPDAPPHPPAAPPRQPTAIAEGVPTLLWITPADCSLEREPALAALLVRAVAIIDPDGAAAGHGAQADRIALDDALARAAARWRVPACRVAGIEALAALAEEIGARQVVTGRIGVGPGMGTLIAARGALRRAGIALAEHVRAWDRAVWPHATRGFFALRDHIPHVLAEMVG
ncbi:FAD-binding domain-containing protein [Novosphingobium sp. FSW06-99]|uniref:FAD-binding domain-containing protein n=1 Tax=Novosphingobium sp. FSW06-99 TaxID=1739113 RepID=UPI000B2021FE|nr:FAD-binding domain-containing protein [Novosphingobium sp. FSW06-99]